MYIIFLVIFIVGSESGVLNEDKDKLSDAKNYDSQITTNFLGANNNVNDKILQTGEEIKDFKENNETASEATVVGHTEDKNETAFEKQTVGDVSIDNLLKNIEEAKNQTSFENVEVGCPEGKAIGANGDCVNIKNKFRGATRKIFSIEGCPTGFARADGVCKEIEE